MLELKTVDELVALLEQSIEVYVIAYVIPQVGSEKFGHGCAGHGCSFTQMGLLDDLKSGVLLTSAVEHDVIKELKNRLPTMVIAYMVDGVSYGDGTGNRVTKLGLRVYLEDEVLNETLYNEEEDQGGEQWKSK